MDNKVKELLKSFFYCLLPSRDHISKPSHFFIPKFNTCFFVRLGVLALLAFLFFGLICRPAFVKGKSMEPTYNRVGFDFCWRPAYWFSKPKRGDVIVIRYAGKKLFLKRVIGLPGDRLSFKNGKLFLNRKELQEPYVKNPCDWNLPERTVENGKIYVIGDNRSMQMKLHQFGAVKLKRVYGAPLW